MLQAGPAVERALGARIVRSERAPWGSKNRTSFVDLADGRHVVVQEFSDRETARLRLSAAAQLAVPLIEHGVPVARVLAYDLDAPAPWGVFDRLPGEPGYVAADDDLSGAAFPAIARGMGILARRIRSLDPTGFELPRLWAEPEALGEAAQRWLGDLEPYLAAREVDRARGVVDSLPSLLAGRPVAVCHGDFGPQNVLVVGDRVSALLDLEDARIADPLLDVAWWAWLVRAHTPHAFAATWRGFLDAAAIDREEEELFDDRLMALIVVRLLETADTIRGTAPARHPGWAERLARTLEWLDRPLEVLAPIGAGRDG